MKAIKDAYLIELRPSHDKKCYIGKENGTGNFDTFYTGPKLHEPLLILESWRKKRELKRKINKLVGKKVIFFPIETKDEFHVFNKKDNKLGFKIHVHRVNDDYCIDELIEKVEAEEFEPFEKRDAKYVTKFLEDYIFKKSRVEK